MLVLIKKILFYLYYFHLHYALPAFLIWLAVFAGLFNVFYKKHMQEKTDIVLQNTMLLFSAALFIYLAFFIFGYICLDNVYDSFGTHIGSVAWMFLNGMPTHLNPDTPEKISVLYGPNLYIIHAMFLKIFGAHFLTVKMPGLLCFSLTLFITYKSIRSVLDFELTFVFIGVLTTAFLAMNVAAFYHRADPLLILLTSVCFFAAISCPVRHQIILALFIGLLAGIAMNIKIHAMVYFVPSLALCLCRKDQRWPAFAAFLVSLISILILPIIIWPMSFMNYYYYIEAAANHGLLLANFISNVQLLLFYVLPVMAMMVYRRSLCQEEDQVIKVAVYAIIVGGLLCAVPSSKIGAGHSHYLPFLPTIAYVSAFQLKTVAPSKINSWPKGKWLQSCFAAWLLTLVLQAALPQGYAAKVLYERLQLDRAGSMNDVRAFLEAHKNHLSQIGFGASSPWGDTTAQNRKAMALMDLQLAVVFEKRYHSFDYHSLTDYYLTRTSLPSSSTEAIEQCKVQCWLVPTGEEPFTIVSIYDGRKLFNDGFRDVFKKSYVWKGSTKFYDVYCCRKKM